MPNVLLVEPDVDLAKTIEEYLVREKYKVSSFRDAQQAVLAADENRPDIVVLELAMPKNNGLAFLQEFRSYTDWLGVPIIVYSRIPRDDTGLSSADWQKQGVVAYLYKPTKTLANLLNIIEQNLNNYEIT